MKELSLNILDIAKNSVKAGALLVEILIEDTENRRVLTIRDDGCGMDSDFLERVTDPFTTTRTTRKVGMGLPLLKLAAEQTGGSLSITSSRGENHGTTVTAVFFTDHLDCVPLGDYAGTMSALIQGSPDIDFVFSYRNSSGLKYLSTAQMREILDGVPLDTPEVLLWIEDSLNAPPEEE